MKPIKCFGPSVTYLAIFTSLHSTPGAFSGSTLRRCAFTLIELILVMSLLVIITSIAAPAMSKFIRGRALDSEAQRMFSLMHEAQSRAVSEGERR